MIMVRTWSRTGKIVAAVTIFALAAAILTIWRSPQAPILQYVDQKVVTDDINKGSTHGEPSLDVPVPENHEDKQQFVTTTSEAPNMWPLPSSLPTVEELMHSPVPEHHEDEQQFVTTISEAIDVWPTPSSAPTSEELMHSPVPAPSPTPESKVDVQSIGEKHVVMGKLSSDDTDWVAQELPDWQNSIYVVDLPSNATSPTGLRTKMNKAKEATPYLTYIVENYPNFADVTAFIHSHRKGYPQAWHTDMKDYDAVTMLRSLRLNYVRERGYVNLRCTQNPGCPDEVQPFRDPPDPERHAELIYPYVYADFFDMPLSAVREQIPVVASACCAQFAVSREQLLKRSKHDYERYLRFLEQTEYDDETIGRVLEYMWHIIFGQDPVDCPKTAKCFCNVYGLKCNSWNRPGGRPGGRLGSRPGSRPGSPPETFGDKPEFEPPV